MNASYNSMHSGGPQSHVTKKCPECMAYMPIKAQVCPSCKINVGKVNRHGMASRKIDWKGYTAAVIAWIIFFLYIWWAFIREQ